jgi:hypothetical protein
VDDKSVCGAHVDGQNLAFGLCFISPFGVFDHTQGGHLVLHDMKAVLEVAPGSQVFIPSALLTHENIGIGEHETRHAITAYTPGAYFRYYEEGFRRVPKRTPKEYLILGGWRWAQGKRLYPHISELL